VEGPYGPYHLGSRSKYSSAQSATTSWLIPEGTLYDCLARFLIAPGKKCRFSEEFVNMQSRKVLSGRGPSEEGILVVSMAQYNVSSTL
jgi:hypothetical protein